MDNKLNWSLWGLLMLLGCSGFATANPKMQLSDFWMMEPPGVARHVAAYGKITNIGSSEDTLVAVKSQVAQTTEVHESVIQNGRAHMRKVTYVSLKPGGSLTLKPQSYHLMFKGLKEPLKAGDRVPVVFVFEEVGETKVEVSVMEVQ